MDPMWEDTERTLLDLAGVDLEHGGEVQPTMLAFRGEQALFLATLRPFAKGAYHDPIIEVGCLASALNADRVALSLAGRAWSTDDPIPPVLPDGPDLRQRVVVIHFVDGADDAVSAWQVLAPFTVTAGQVRWEPAQRMEGAAGWIASALEVLVAQRHQLTGCPEETGEQVLRCESLGHRLAWGPDTIAEVEALIDRVLVTTGPTPRRPPKRPHKPRPPARRRECT